MRSARSSFGAAHLGGILSCFGLGRITDSCAPVAQFVGLEQPLVLSRRLQCSDVICKHLVCRQAVGRGVSIVL